jgi:hypothetical protein
MTNNSMEKGLNLNKTILQKKIKQTFKISLSLIFGSKFKHLANVASARNNN